MNEGDPAFALLFSKLVVTDITRPNRLQSAITDFANKHRMTFDLVAPEKIKMVCLTVDYQVRFSVLEQFWYNRRHAL